VRFPAGGVRGDMQEEIALFALTEIVSARRAAGDRPRDASSPSPRGEGEAATFATDPVCGMPVDVAATLYQVDRGETRIYFCSAGCKERFQREPELFQVGNVPA